MRCARKRTSASSEANSSFTASTVRPGTQLLADPEQCVELGAVREWIELQHCGLRLDAHGGEPRPQQPLVPTGVTAEDPNLGRLESLSIGRVSGGEGLTEADEVAVRVENDHRKVCVDEELLEQHAHGVGLPGAALPAQEGVPVERGAGQQSGPSARRTDFHVRGPLVLQRGPHLTRHAFQRCIHERADGAELDASVRAQRAEDPTGSHHDSALGARTEQLAECGRAGARAQQHQVTGDLSARSSPHLEGAPLRRAGSQLVLRTHGHYCLLLQRLRLPRVAIQSGGRTLES